MPLDDELLDRSVRETWTALFGLPVEPLAEPIAHAERQRYLTAIMQIAGDWAGAVLIDFEPDLARSLTAGSLDRPEDAVVIDHMRDVLGEAVNIVGGYLKQALPPSSVLSLPTLMVGVDYRAFLPGAQPVNRLGYRCAGRRFQVTVFRLEPPGRASEPAFSRFLRSPTPEARIP